MLIDYSVRPVVRGACYLNQDSRITYQIRTDFDLDFSGAATGFRVLFMIKDNRG